MGWRRTIAIALSTAPVLHRFTNYRRTVAFTGTINLPQPSRRGSRQKRSVLIGLTTTVIVQRTVAGGTEAFFVFTSPTASSTSTTWAPDSWLFDSTKFTTPTFYFEATLKSGSSVVPALARLYDMTSLTEVPGSRVTTLATTPTRVRSAGFSLPISGHVYRAELGKTTAACTMYSAKLIVEVP